MSGVRVEVGPSVLSTLRRRAVAVAEDFTGQHGALAALVDDAGSAVLIDAARRFADRWGHGMGLVVDDAGGPGRAPGGGGDAYLDTD